MSKVGRIAILIIIATGELLVSGCASEYYDMTSPVTPPDDAAVLACAEDDCLVSIQDLDSEDWILQCGWKLFSGYSCKPRYFVLGEIKLDPGIYNLRTTVCSTGLPDSFHPHAVREVDLKLNAEAGHYYNMNRRGKASSYCNAAVDIEDLKDHKVVARWCHPKKILEHPEGCEPVSDKWLSCIAPLEKSMKLTAGEQYDKALECSKHGFGQQVVWRWRCLAAHQGNYLAQNHLGHYYRTGSIPVGKDLVQAFKWLSLSARNGNEHTARWLLSVSKQMTAMEVAEAERLVAEWEPNPEECEVLAEHAGN